MPFEDYFERTTKFLRKLKRNNDRDWFEEHREEYERDVLEPTKALTLALGEELRAFAPNVHAIPKVDKSIFRIHRDTRFSEDKSPYKTHVGVFFWEGKRRKMECSGFYLHVESDTTFFAAGAHILSRDLLPRYRKAVADDERGEKLRGVIKSIEKKGATVGGEHYKRVPRGFDPDSPRADLLKYNGLWASFGEERVKDLLGADVVKEAAKRFKKLEPLHRWLVETLEG
ncbi:MAG: TIGR02453 family protein [Ignavibacteriales bacterium]|nr:TIGR02453 family protein [Ignavibacteriales bacterium]